MQEIWIGQQRLRLLPQRAVYLEQARSLLVSDVHLGKSETFQHYGLPVASQVNQTTLARLEQICQQVQPQALWVLGDLFHAEVGLVDEVIDAWLRFLDRTQVSAYLVVGNHDRAMSSTLTQLHIECFSDAVELAGLTLSHEPWLAAEQPNLCGHLHPCVRLKTRLDSLRLPCFYWQPKPLRLTLPAFGEFTGGYEVALRAGAVAYAIAEDQIVALGAP